MNQSVVPVKTDASNIIKQTISSVSNACCFPFLSTKSGTLCKNIIVNTKLSPASIVLTSKSYMVTVCCAKYTTTKCAVNAEINTWNGTSPTVLRVNRLKKIL
ncbi:Uncharacterised protein [Streptococcus pneumoniae]|nr:Uncharacterised protein [Streptococcus pneumoniae]